MLLRFGLSIIWFLRLLPLALLAPIGNGFGSILFYLGRERREIALTNVGLCFPHLTKSARRRLVRKHFKLFARSLLEHGILWWSSKECVEKLVRVEGLEHWHAVKDKPVILLAPHFVGLDFGGIRLSTEYPLVSMYSHQKNPVFDAILLHGRNRFGTSTLLSRQQGIRSIVKALRNGASFYYLPDMDFGARDAIFVPFFGVRAATITGLSRIAQLTGARVVPCITTQLPGASGYVVRFYPAWDNFPTNDVESDTRYMNAFIEERVREMPEQYFWLHKRFKTRPPGEAKFYK